MSSPPPIRVHSSACGKNGMMTDAQENITYDTYWPNVHTPVFTTGCKHEMQPPPGFQNVLLLRTT